MGRSGELREQLQVIPALICHLHFPPPRCGSPEASSAFGERRTPAELSTRITEEVLSHLPFKHIYPIGSPKEVVFGRGSSQDVDASIRFQPPCHTYQAQSVVLVFPPFLAEQGSRKFLRSPQTACLSSRGSSQRKAPTKHSR